MHTKHLHIRRFTLEDAEACSPLVSLPEVLRYTGEQPQTSVEEVAETLRSRPLRDYTVYGFGRMACIEDSSGRLVGFCGLKYLEDLGEVDIGYRFVPDCWGKGYATESALAVMGTAGEHGISRIIGLVEPGNGASARVLEKLGLVFERHVQPEGCSKVLRQFATPGTGPGDAFKPRSPS